MLRDAVMFTPRPLGTFALTTPLLIALALVFVLLLAWKSVRSRQSTAAASEAQDNVDTLAAWPPQATRVLTDGERRAYDVLRTALPAQVILAQVPLQRFIKVPTRNSYAEWLRRVGHISADFVVCDRHSQVIAVVEILTGEDAPGGRAQRRRDRMIRVLKAAQIAVHVWRATNLPSAEAAREAILPGQPLEAPVHPLAGRAGVSDKAPARLPPQLALPADEGVTVREAPPSTWFDDLDSAVIPLEGHPSSQPNDAKPRGER
jgi:hypothetical protein